MIGRDLRYAIRMLGRDRTVTAGRRPDAATLAVSALVLIAAALVASYFPARAALRLEPLAALRAE